MRTLIAPSKLTPGTLTARLALISPARPAGVIKKFAVPLVTLTAPSPRLSETFVAEIRMRCAPATVCRSNAKLPLSVWPITLTLTSVPATRRYGPAGASSVTAVTPTIKVSLIADVVLLITTPNVPPSETPGTFSATVALMVPANPAGVTRKKPVPLVTSTMLFVPSPIARRTFAMPTRTRLTAPAPAVVTFSSAKSPRSVMPWTSSSIPVASTRRYGPAGRLSARV